MGSREVTAEEKKALTWCLTSEINAFEKELVARGGARRDHYGNVTFDAVAAHLRLLESARGSVERIKVTG